MSLLTRRVDSAVVVIGLVVGVVALLAILVPDALWLAALGREIVAGGIPDGVPFAAASTHGWENVPVLAELAFHGLERGFGDRGLQLAQVVAVALAFALLAWDARRGGAGRGLAPVLFLAGVGLFISLIAVRVQLFSLVFFPLTLVLLRGEARAPSRRIWLLVPLVALWSNLHGAVLAGLATAAAYLLVDRARREPLVAIGVLVASFVALLATPALTGTADYYRSVLDNEAAQRGVGLWAPLSISDPFDVIFIVVGLALVALALAGRPRLWELAALAGLAVLTAQAARGGAWLLFAAVAPATRARPARWMPERVPSVTLVPIAAMIVAGIAKGPIVPSAGSSLVRAAIEQSGGTPILADPLPAEQVAYAGGRVWVSNPLDAFRPTDQRLYLDWFEGKPAGDAALTRVRVVLVLDNSDAQRRLATNPQFREVRRDANAVLYVRI